MVQQELEALDAARTAALADLDRLAVASTDPSPEMVEQVCDPSKPCCQTTFCTFHCTANAEMKTAHVVELINVRPVLEIGLDVAASLLGLICCVGLQRHLFMQSSQCTACLRSCNFVCCFACKFPSRLLLQMTRRAVVIIHEMVLMLHRNNAISAK